MKDIATKNTTNYILDTYQLQALKKFGQNFIIDSNIIQNIVACGDIDEETFVIEIGPGIGALTQVLSRNAKKVRSYEIDTRFKPVYEEFLTQDNIEIIFQDFLDVDIEKEVKKIKEKYQKVCIVANLPYYITTQIIEKIIISNCQIDTMVIMIQKEVAKKFTSDYKNPLLFMIEEIGDIEYAFTVSKNVFIPTPHVDSAVIKIIKERDLDKQLYHVLQVAFKQRRKTIYNNLKDTFDNVKYVLEVCNIPNNARSEELTLNDFKKLTKYL